LITRPTLLTPISDKKGINIDLCLSFLRGLPLGHYSALVRMCSQLKCILSYISFNEYELKIISVSRKFDVSTIVDSPFFYEWYLYSDVTNAKAQGKSIHETMVVS
jgi:hypothetical protein